MGTFVTIIVLMHNSERTIRKCACSLFSQTMRELEFVFVDDGSLDNSIDELNQELERWPERNNNTKIIALPFNVGQSKARKIGLGSATSPFVIFCDSDDYVEADMYQSLYDYARDNDCEIVRCLNVKESKDGSEIRLGRVYSEKVWQDKNLLLSNAILNRGLSSLCNKLVSRRLFDDIVFPPGNVYEDYVLVVELFLKTSKIGHINVPYYHYVQYFGSTIHPASADTVETCSEEMRKNVIFLEKYLRSQGIFDRYSLEIAASKYSVFSLCADAVPSHRFQRWKTYLPQMDKHFLINPYITIKQKFKILLYNSFCFLFCHK